MPARIYIGTSNWADPGLAASGFYPEGLKSTPERLAYFAQRFDLAEIDSTYYALPSRRNLTAWAAAVPDDFRFVMKALALFTQHPTNLSAIPASFREQLPPEIAAKPRVYYKDVPPEIRDELWAIFRRGLATLRETGKLGAVLLDFPPWFGPSPANRDYLGEAREKLAGEDIVVEFRNRGWVDDEGTAAATFGLLRELGMGFCCVDEPAELKTGFPPVYAATAEVAEVRFRGRNVEAWERKSASMEERLDWRYSREELLEWVPRIQELAQQAREVYISFSTKAGDQSVSNARMLQELLGKAGAG
ncbi:MAG TPA: DUF72 domain-containing protein [Dehalococcoidia bacterium]|nr:DUF72 domain-containing protein [Dehalococcoidia bacterium]